MRALFNLRAWHIVCEPQNRGLAAPAFCAAVLALAGSAIVHPLSVVGLGDGGELLVGRVIAAIVSVMWPGVVFSIALYATVLAANDVLNGRPLSLLRVAEIIGPRLPAALPVLALWILTYSLIASLHAVLPQLAWIISLTAIFCGVFAFPAYILDGLPFETAVRFSSALAFERSGVVTQALALPFLVVIAADIADYAFWYIPIVGIFLSFAVYSFALAISVVHLVDIYRRLRNDRGNTAPLHLTGSLDDIPSEAEAQSASSDARNCRPIVRLARAKTHVI